MSMTIENIEIKELPKTYISKEHIKQLERMFLSADFKFGFDIVDEDVADILTTFVSAYHEGDWSICHIDYGIDDPSVHAVRALCQKLNIYYDIKENESESEITLYLPRSTDPLSVQQAADESKRQLIDFASQVSSGFELGRFGFICEGMLRSRGLEVSENVMIWCTMDGITVLTEYCHGRLFNFYGEMTESLIQELVIEYHFDTFINKASVVIPPSSNKTAVTHPLFVKRVSYDESFFGNVWTGLTQQHLKMILEEFKEYHVYSLVSTKNGYSLLEGMQVNCIGFLLTRCYISIPEGIELPKRIIGNS
ncbi:hypothetical protein [Paenibacillus sp. FSL K6-2859]|uniref:hypothetical protein n=1 Tax=Paenibacillus sp. FSL K6-2859 TaxID=2921482 RepID=UPI0030F52C28